MRLLVFPRDPNPYQRLLYGELERLDVQVTYLGNLTPSQTLNLLLLPLETAARRMAGARLIHLHWVFTFTFAGAPRLKVLRRLAQIWFRGWLGICRLLGLHLVWTAHNVLPHSPVFADDASARRALVRSADLVLAHSQSTFSQLAALGAVPANGAVIPHGPFAPAWPASSVRSPGAAGKPYRFLFFGQVHEYKGVDDLLAAFLAVPAEITAHLTVAGQCEDSTLRARLGALAKLGGPRIVLRLERIPEQEVTPLLAAADVLVLPFRRVTTSGSVMLGLSHGRPLIVPDLPGLADLPDQAVLRYQAGVPGLTAALARLASAERETLAAMSVAAFTYAGGGMTWKEIAERTVAELRCVLGEIPGASPNRLPRECDESVPTDNTEVTA